MSYLSGILLFYMISCTAHPHLLTSNRDVPVEGDADTSNVRNNNSISTSTLSNIMLGTENESVNPFSSDAMSTGASNTTSKKVETTTTTHTLPKHPTTDVTTAVGVTTAIGVATAVLSYETTTNSKFRDVTSLHLTNQNMQSVTAGEVLSHSDVADPFEVKDKPTTALNFSKIIYIYCKHFFNLPKTKAPHRTIDANLNGINPRLSSRMKNHETNSQHSTTTKHGSTFTTENVSQIKSTSNFTRSSIRSKLMQGSRLQSKTMSSTTHDRVNNLMVSFNTSNGLFNNVTTGNFTEQSTPEIYATTSAQLQNFSILFADTATRGDNDTLNNSSEINHEVSDNLVTTTKKLSAQFQLTIKTPNNIMTGIVLFFQKTNQLLRHSFYSDNYFSSSTRLVVGVMPVIVAIISFIDT